jgi:hypothetical protein
MIKNGILEYWNSGIMDIKILLPHPLFHHSMAYSLTPG